MYKLRTFSFVFEFTSITFAFSSNVPEKTLPINKDPACGSDTIFVDPKTSGASVEVKKVIRLVFLVHNSL